MTVEAFSEPGKPPSHTGAARAGCPLAQSSAYESATRSPGRSRFFLPHELRAARNDGDCGRLAR
jgi:hypothetical protein